tara:strand:- start:1231 stop:2160 length:930 start_codon:yes stop_codon:yes gene_type:complete
MNLDPISQMNLFGHNQLFDNLLDLYNSDRLPNKILLSGEKGIGKSTISYHLINYVLSKDEEYSYDYKNYKINPQNKSFKLMHNNSCPNFHFIDVEKDKKNIEINQIRELIVDLNKSSFNSKVRFVLIDNIELLNVNSVNALLKILEEPNDNIIFILINNNKKVLTTLKSRCINFKVFLSFEKSIKVINQILEMNIYDLANKEFINNYSTPGQLLRIIKFSNDQKIDLVKSNLKDFLLQIFQSRIFKKEKLVEEIIYSLIELYFRNNVSVNNINQMNLYNYFIKRINNAKKYNLDKETIFMEFGNRVFDG